ncbi:MAG: 3-phosphoshikimate 1-carboxyvinyltransferase [Thermoplasmatota archaeon]
MEIRPSAVRGTVPAPPSKSYTHRALFLGLLARDSFVAEPLLSEDPLATLTAIRALGARVEETQKGLRIQGARSERGIQAPDDILDARNSGTTLRLGAPISALANGTAVWTGDASLRKRPMQPLLESLGSLGVDAFSTRGNGCAPVVVRGPMVGGKTAIAGDVSSQFVSGLLLAGTGAPKGLEISITTPLKSRPYVEITLAMIRAFGGRAEESAPSGRSGAASGSAGAAETLASFEVAGAQDLKGTQYRVPGDWSSAAFPLAAAAITGGDVTVTNLDPLSEQGDKRILDALRAFGAIVEERKDGARVTTSARSEGHGLHGITFDLSDTPDMFPILCAVAAHANGPSTLRGAKHLRFKESDRIAAMVRNLHRMGVQCEELEDGAVIHGDPKRVHGHSGAPDSLDTEEDHRILMALAVCALGAKGPTRIADDASFAVSYPRFPDAFRHLGAEITLSPGEPGENPPRPPHALDGPTGSRRSSR